MLDISNNTKITGKGVASIAYNLAFSPKLIYLNVSNTVTDAAVSDLIESLYKLLNISSSLEILDCSGITHLNPNLTLEFFKSVGEIKTLRVLDIKGSGMLGAT